MVPVGDWPPRDPEEIGPLPRVGSFVETLERVRLSGDLGLVELRVRGLAFFIGERRAVEVCSLALLECVDKKFRLFVGVFGAALRRCIQLSLDVSTNAALLSLILSKGEVSFPRSVPS